MRLFLLIISFCLLSPVVAKDVYRSVDEHGNVIYSDTPLPDAEIISIEEVQTVDPGQVPAFRYTPEKPEAPAYVYNRLEIVSPENDAAFVNPTGEVTISAVIEPVLNSTIGHRLILSVDGKETASGLDTQFVLGNLDRGTHTVTVAVVDKTGQQLIASPTVSFTLHRPSALHPQ